MGVNLFHQLPYAKAIFLFVLSGGLDGRTKQLLGVRYLLKVLESRLFRKAQSIHSSHLSLLEPVLPGFAHDGLARVLGVSKPHVVEFVFTFCHRLLQIDHLPILGRNDALDLGEPRIPP